MRRRRCRPPSGPAAATTGNGRSLRCEPAVDRADPPPAPRPSLAAGRLVLTADQRPHHRSLLLSCCRHRPSGPSSLGSPPRSRPRRRQQRRRCPHPDIHISALDLLHAQLRRGLLGSGEVSHVHDHVTGRRDGPFHRVNIGSTGRVVRSSEVCETTTRHRGPSPWLAISDPPPAACPLSSGRAHSARQGTPAVPAPWLPPWCCRRPPEETRSRRQEPELARPSRSPRSYSERVNAPGESSRPHLPAGPNKGRNRSKTSPAPS